MMTPDAIAPFHFVPGTLPVLLSIPHVGTHIPEALRSDYAEVAWQRADTDWHLDRLYAFAHQLGASVLQATHSRSVIDLNRPPDDQSLYPGHITTGLGPSETFRGEPLYLAGRAPDAAEISRRLALYWQPYHETLAAELERLRSLHGHVLLWDAHSIASQLPRLFDGKLPDLNLGTADGASCASEVLAPVAAIAKVSGFSAIVNGRFKGGHITRRYGSPSRGVHAIQLELCQCLYMNESPPFDYRPEGAAQLQPALKAMLGAAADALGALAP
jgi:N-formylglutamate deformylase